nr:efflux transporter outer membrane subunit [Phaeovibrio sulfidiphilus]
MALGLAGCMVGPDPVENPAHGLPPSWSSEPGTTVADRLQLSGWWRRLNDPELDSLIDEAVAGNLDVATAEARIREARAGYRQAGGALWPDVTGSASATRARSTNPVGTGSGPVSTQFRAGFDASWELDLFGGKRRALEAAARGLDAASADLRSTLLTLIGDVSDVYVDVRGTQARLDLARRTADSQRRTAELIRANAVFGLSSDLDTARADAQAATTEAAVRDLEAALTLSLNRLAVLTGKEPATLARRFQTPAPVPSPVFPIPTAIPAVVLEQRPDVQALGYRYAQSTAKVGQAEAALYPSVSLVGNIATTATSLGDLGRASTISWAFGPSVSVPIFNAGKLSAAVEMEEARRDQAFLSWRAGVLSALEEVENAIVSLARERERFERLDRSARSWEQALILSESLFRNGNASFLDLLDAERSAFSSQDMVLQSRMKITRDYIALNKALGGGWDGEAPSRVPTPSAGPAGDLSGSPAPERPATAAPQPAGAAQQPAGATPQPPASPVSPRLPEAPASPVPPGAAEAPAAQPDTRTPVPPVQESTP